MVVNAGVVNDASVAPETGIEVAPVDPTYHWYEIEPTLLPTTLSVALVPLVTVWLRGWETIVSEIDRPGLAESLVGVGPVGDVGDDEHADARASSPW